MSRFGNISLSATLFFGVPHKIAQKGRVLSSEITFEWQGDFGFCRRGEPQVRQILSKEEGEGGTGNGRSSTGRLHPCHPEGAPTTEISRLCLFSVSPFSRKSVKDAKG
jgi:hypothetical protein